MNENPIQHNISENYLSMIDVNSEYFIQQHLNSKWFVINSVPKSSVPTVNVNTLSNIYYYYSILQV